MRSIYLSLFLLGCSLFGHSQYTPKIETDRPDQTETPFLVPPRYLQAEFGLTRITESDNNYQWQHPTALIKYGISNRLELRTEITPSTSHLQTNTLRSTLVEPFEVGFKLRFFEEKGLRPKTSLIAHVGLPFLASKQFRSAAATYTTRLTLQHTLSPTMALGYNIGMERDVDGVQSAFYTIAPGINLSANWYAYVEAFGSFNGVTADQNLDAGIAFNPTNNTRIDLSAGVGLGNSPLQHYYALGFSFRLPL